MTKRHQDAPSRRQNRRIVEALKELTMQLDKVDEDIVWRLAMDGRQTIAQLASDIGIAPSTCHARVTALRASGVLKSFHAQVDLEAVGLSFQALVMVRMRPQRREEIQA
jgi:DNA-binding Lrp family transcriptional regulator